jgi:hypothetical protein
VALSATGTDPEGGALAFAWDLDGDLLYETEGPSVTFSSPVDVPAGTVRKVRVRALDPDGAYAVASTTVTVTAPTRLAFVTQPGGATAGSPLSPQPVVRIEDPNGAIVPAFNGPVTLAFGTNPNAASTVGGTTTVNAVNGVATFTNLFVTGDGTGYTLVASAPGSQLTPATSAPFTIAAVAVSTPPAPPPPAAPPTFCNPRPKVVVATSVPGPGQLNAVIAAQTAQATPSNSLASIQITQIGNATLLVNGTPVTTAGTTIPLLANTSQLTLQVTRQAAGQATMVAFTVSDVCGEWKSFVGGGPGAF